MIKNPAAKGTIMGVMVITVISVITNQLTYTEGFQIITGLIIASAILTASE